MFTMRCLAQNTSQNGLSNESDDIFIVVHRGMLVFGSELERVLMVVNRLQR